jgi:hypothetical protein
MRRTFSGFRSVSGIFGLSWMVASASGCGAGDQIDVPTTGTIEVVTQTTGAEPDPDGYTFAIDTAAPSPIGVADTVSQPELEPAFHSVTLGGLAETCAVAGSNPQVVTVAAGAVARVTFRVTCTSPSATGSLRVTAATTGVNLDPDGYLIALDPSLSQVLGVDEVVTLEGISIGDRVVRLSGVADNCTVRGDNPRSVTLIAGQITDTGFEITCWPPLTGRIAFRLGETADIDGSEIYIRNADGTGSVNLTNSLFDNEHQPSWSPDGTQVAFSRISFEGGAFEQAFIVSASGGEPMRLLPDTVDAEQIKWSPDGSRLLFLRIGTLCTVRPDGTDIRALTPDSLDVFSASWSPDGTRIAYETLDSALYIVSSEGGEPVDIAAGLDLSIRSVAWSPDGSRIAFLGTRRREGGFDGIFTIGPDGQGLTGVFRATMSPASPTWSPDGTKLAFTLETVPREPPPDDGFRETSVIHIMNADGSGVRPLTGINETAGDPAWGP